MQVIPRAGSGKTFTLVARACYLIKHLGESPSEVLLIAFNRSLADEMKDRLEKLLGNNAPHVMTFHALAYALVHPREALLYNEPTEANQSLSRVVQWVIDDHLQIPATKTKIRELMLAHFREDWEQPVAGGYDRTKDDLLHIRRSLPRESMHGEHVKSFGEKVIADFLFEHDINYLYKHDHRWGSINYRPDFTIFTGKDSGVVIQYFGLSGDSDYDKRSREKREYWSRKSRWSFLEFSPQNITDHGAGVFKRKLKTSLEDLGISCQQLCEDELWHRVKERAIDRFTNATQTFIGRCQKHCILPDELASLHSKLCPMLLCRGSFSSARTRLYAEYMSRLLDAGEDDFDGLMQHEAQGVSKGNTAFDRRTSRGDLKRVRHVLIDEYQDFSELFFRLVDAIRKQNSEARFFCVGDDWQAINGFAGSDLRFYENFGDYFPQFNRLYLRSNYRSCSAVVDFGNNLMQGLGVPAVARKTSADAFFSPTSLSLSRPPLETERHLGDRISPVILRLASRAIRADKDIVLLARHNSLPWFVNDPTRGTVGRTGLKDYLEFLRRTFLPADQRERLTISTVHKYKGLERSVVVVLDVLARSYPLVHPDWIFSRPLGETEQKIIDEERRLFYVAATRAVDALVLITEAGGLSPFLEEIEQRTKVTRLDWKEFPPIQSVTPPLVVKVGSQHVNGAESTFAIKDCLKAEGFRWHSGGWRAWAKSFPVERFQSILSGNLLGVAPLAV